MNSPQTPDKINNLKTPTTWMIKVIEALEKGNLDKKTTSNIAKKALKKIEKYSPKIGENENYENVKDLCISLSTVERAKENFQKFYLESLKEELNKMLTILEEEKNE